METEAGTTPRQEDRNRREVLTESMLGVAVLERGSPLQGIDYNCNGETERQKERAIERDRERETDRERYREIKREKAQPSSVFFTDSFSSNGRLGV